MLYHWLFVIMVGGIFNGLMAWLFSIMNNKFGFLLRQELFEDVMKKDVEFFDQNKTGELLSRFNTDIQVMQDAFSSTFGMMIKSIIYCFFSLGIIVYVSPHLSLCIVVILVPIMIIMPINGFILGKINKSVSDANAKATALS